MALRQRIFTLTLIFFPLSALFCESPDCCCCPSEFQIGADYTHASLKTDHKPSFSGHLGGIHASYSYQGSSGLYVAAKLAWKGGTVHHDRVVDIDAQERLGVSFSCLTLYSGVGYRHFNQKLTNRALRLKYNEFYVPLGAIVSYTWNEWVMTNLEVTWMPQVFPSVSLHPIHGANWTLSKKLNNYALALPFIFTPCDNKNIQWSLRLFFEQWHNGPSTAKLSRDVPLGIPGNRYHFFGVDLSLAFQF